MATKKRRQPMSKVKQRLKRLIEQYREAQREQLTATTRLGAANTRMSVAKLQLAVHVQKHKIDSYRVIFAVEKDKNGKPTSRRIVGGKNLKIDGVSWPSDSGNPPTGPGGTELPENETFCDEQMNLMAENPNWVGESWCICEDTTAAGGGVFPGGGVECFGEDEIPEDPDDE